MAKNSNICFDLLSSLFHCSEPGTAWSAGTVTLIRWQIYPKFNQTANLTVHVDSGKNQKFSFRNFSYLFLVPGGVCASNPCQNSGNCTNTEDFSFNCDCTPTYTGTICDIEIILLPSDELRNLNFSLIENEISKEVVGPANSRVRIDLAPMPSEMCDSGAFVVNVENADSFDEFTFYCLVSPVSIYSRLNTALIRWSPFNRDHFTEDSANYVLQLEASMYLILIQLYKPVIRANVNENVDEFSQFPMQAFVLGIFAKMEQNAWNQITVQMVICVCAQKITLETIVKQVTRSNSKILFCQNVMSK